MSSMATLFEVFDAVARERAYQEDTKPRQGVSTTHTVAGWLLVMEHELREARDAWVKYAGNERALGEILQVVACGVACLEQHGIVERHRLLQWSHVLSNVET